MSARALQRALPIALAAAILSCQQLRDPTASAEQTCPRACAVDCDCLPSGYCASSVQTAAMLGLGPEPQGASWIMTAPGFPPGAEIAYTIHGGFDVEGRDGASPSTLQFNLFVNGQPAINLQATYSSFPVWADDFSQADADGNGVLTLDAQLASCAAGLASTCTIDPASTLTAALVDTTPYSEAPPCD